VSAYNLLKAVLECPHSGTTDLETIEFRFGLLEFREYHLGEELNWGTKGDRFPKTRPEGGDFVGEGYVECFACGRDYWVSVCYSIDGHDVR
jgi:hypothetical protein